MPQTSELALAYALRAARHGHPHQSLAGIRLTGARLSGWTLAMEGRDGTRLPMPGADLTGADLRRATFHRVDLTGADLSGADLTRAELHGCRLGVTPSAGCPSRAAWRVIVARMCAPSGRSSAVWAARRPAM
ncbi:MAG: pentapeptide repeat-containing protein [Pseudonocardiaceae bacterium]